MTSWQIEPGQARAILAQAETDAASIGTATRTLETVTDQAISAVRGGTQSAAALAGLAVDPIGVDILAAKQQVSTAIAATRAAITAYEHGDQEMATNANRHVADVEWGGDE
ncbi:DUF6507 family protein [Curtobacterium sp. ER1/6]|uniref:DUF6507 family protein n=1 Tax=Curtobacterium sp. ER1/6 TaxID=1891920 RepID=UPI00084FA355|nr:DUF6507 family protein [Curtobacterium sp. ER1/6]OEI70188.1 hypothetical protein Cus16_0811 [Curtobacterium sp. ER1/6]